ncbi:hypothetical protein GQ600_20480 [Phytophthora cactorum]|nr:hypothetical protein GQ600_20480 [Phytophthora cactorum]
MLEHRPVPRTGIATCGSLQRLFKLFSQTPSLCKSCSKGVRRRSYRTLLMYYRDTLVLAPQHILHQEVQRVHATLSPLRQCEEELLEWGSKSANGSSWIISCHFHYRQLKTVLTQKTKQNNLASVAGRCQRGAQKHIETNSRPCRPSTRACVRLLQHGGSATTPPGQSWPTGLTTLKGNQISDFLVQFVMEGGMAPSRRSQETAGRRTVSAQWRLYHASLTLVAFHRFADVTKLGKKRTTDNRDAKYGNSVRGSAASSRLQMHHEANVRVAGLANSSV